MKYLIFFFGFFCLTGALNEKNKPLYVWANSGLVLREAPDLTGEKIKTIPYGSRVAFIDFDYEHSFSLKISEKVTVESAEGEPAIHPEFLLPGYWYKIQSGEDIGYAFSGYLSSFPTPVYLENEINPIENYFEKNFKLLEKFERKTPRSYQRKIYSSGIILESRSIEGGAKGAYIFPEISMAEGYLFFNHFWKFEKNINHFSSIGDAMYPLKIEENFWQFWTGGPEGTLEIRKINDFVIITWRNNC